jgi:ATP-grasp domain-containing protein
VKPTILVVTTERWFSTARLVMGLANAGFKVEAACPVQHPVAKTSVVLRPYVYVQHSPLASLADAIEAAKPDLIVPADDVATRNLHQLHDRERRNGRSGQATCTLIERSLGAPESFSTLERRAAILQLAADAGIRVPKTSVITGIADLENWFARFGPPVVLKADSTSGGVGVRITHTLEGAQRAFRELQTARPSSRSPLPRFLWAGRSVVNGQAFVAGCDAISEVVCWAGKVLASVHFQVLSKQYTGGPASVVRRIENTEMTVAVEKIARRLTLSGMHGFDFILEEGTGMAHLIEMNPRATQVGHLTFGHGRDLPAALYAAVSQQPVQIAPKVTENPTIALFPQEWASNRASAYLKSAYHDVPWEEPELVRACVLSCSEKKVDSGHERWISELTGSRILGHDASPTM